LLDGVAESPSVLTDGKQYLRRRPCSPHHECSLPG
jgi:hypothetical protein